MKTKVRQLLCLMLALVLCFGLIPGVSAAEVDAPGMETQSATIETEESSSPPIEETPSLPTEEATEPAITEPIADEEAADDGIMLFSGSKQSGVTLLDLASPYGTSQPGYF